MKRKLLFAGLTMFVGLSIAMAVQVKANPQNLRVPQCCNLTSTFCYIDGEFAGYAPLRNICPL